MPRYNPAELEPRWQRYWETHRCFATPQLPAKKKFYALDMFPYPSGDGLHVGHPEGYTATDIMSRFARMQGASVMHPMGFDAFGLPAEEHAIRTNTPPRVQTEKNIANFTRQLKMLGFSYDWDRVIATTDVNYFRWTQWIFLQLYDTWFDVQTQRGRAIAELPIPESVRDAGDDAIREYQDDHRLAYQTYAPVNWCAELGTVLANEEVKDGLSEVGNHPVTRLPLRQWMLRITAYAERLETGLDSLDWPESIKLLQRNWIGRSTGAEVDFYIGDALGYEAFEQRRQSEGFPRKPDETALRVYTTRPDTLYGATYLVVAPEHAAVERLVTNETRDAVEAYCEAAGKKSDLDRTELAKEKTGVFTGAYAVNPADGGRVPIWVADYVLATYGTGAIMAVPAHDERDFAFARQFEIPIVTVVDPGEAEQRNSILAGEQVFAGEGKTIASGPYDGMQTQETKLKITRDLTARGLGREAVNYKLRDWLFSRQRFWGEPFPILHELNESGEPNGKIRPVAESDLPVDLPQLDDYQPHGRVDPPLDKAPEEWLFPVIDGVRYKRETNTMPQWAGSCWYYLRFLDPHNNETLVDPKIQSAWMPVDLYIGGAEHAVLHLLYARFWHKVLFDRGHVSTEEPFQKLVNQGMILGQVELTGYRDETGGWVSAEQIRSIDAGRHVETVNGMAVQSHTVAPEDAEKKGEYFVLRSDQSIRLESRAHKMSKSRGNVVNPDEVVREYGADALRLYEMFMGPLVATKPWSMEGVSGVRGFLDRVWRMIVDERSESLVLNASVCDRDLSEGQARMLHKTIKVVTHDFETLSFNTAIARLMEFTNFFIKESERPKFAMEQFVLLLAPMAPHLCEELWQLLGHDQSLANASWPEYDETKIAEATREIPVQVKGRLRSKIEVPADADAAEIEAVARKDEKIVALLSEQEVVKVVVVPGRLINFVTR
ncbi:MAG: leucine--tRNA ligase [Planctomycetaceae bacterium]|nr:leucine--tRNA ligase [Planctomycetaceae bacterium]|tara:strand:- start:3042 stop:5873 length:2832 start_codon:yes stop_codon:yes gene_type:complete